ncbi:retrovirus-related Pol polyprotein from transposon TNT 1-94 [Trifolium pratense]|uniref:Retrovirus-related Pol polyprotein from transposon TNT 1-94 n=1 Tax=Trifolium pratense TaxID=57577 RepID=A0A2K3LC04_TRIPR|nr:retrovirus-related Pol polyprotein from transposon TNT 1-94 [Trifolium pratense]
MAGCQAQWLFMLMQELGLKTDDKVRLMLDNKFAIDLPKHPIADILTNTLKTSTLEELKMRIAMNSTN